jgi:hypothetical protein
MKLTPAAGAAGLAVTEAQAAIAAANGHAADLPARPYWQDQPCPPWCGMVVPHQDHVRPEDRYHMSPITDVTLTLEAADVLRFPDGTGGTVLEVSPSFITASLVQGWREREARVFLTHAGTHDIELTVAEAAELAEALSGLVREAMETRGDVR